MLSWDFSLAKRGNLIGSINRNFRGFGREIFTDTGQYVLRMDAASPETTNITHSAVRHFPARSKVRVPSLGPGKNGKEVRLSPEKRLRQLQRLPPEEDKLYQNRFEKPISPTVDVVERTVGLLTLDERAVMLATAVSIEFDYFSRHSG